MSATTHVWEPVELEFNLSQHVTNPYVDIDFWLELTSPDNRHILVYGFWDGGDSFKVRLCFNCAGNWRWKSCASVSDRALQGVSGSFDVVDCPETYKRENANNRGHIRSHSAGHTLQYADGTPFFMLGDTWWTLSTFRFPWSESASDGTFSFQSAVSARKKQGYNTIAAIACFPNWHNDGPSELFDSNGVCIRSAWEEFDQKDDSGAYQCKRMTDEDANRPFELVESQGPVALADFSRINPAYFRNFDRKVRYLHDNGMVLLLESIRRDHGPLWSLQADFAESYSRYMRYLVARYGAFNVVFSAIHLDYVAPGKSLDGPQWNRVASAYFQRYGHPPFGNLMTAIADRSTLDQFGHGKQCPWLTFHGVGNTMRNHAIEHSIYELYSLPLPYPVINQEPYYPGWDVTAGLAPRAECESQEDHYFGRANAWGSVLAGAFAGHIYGSGAYDGSMSKSPNGHPTPAQSLQYCSSVQMGSMKEFLFKALPDLSALEPAQHLMYPRKAPCNDELSLYGWSYCAATADRSICILYFEKQAVAASLFGLVPNATYQLAWFHPVSGEWARTVSETTQCDGTLALGPFPDSTTVAHTDWALACSHYQGNR